MKIEVKNGRCSTVFELNDSSASGSLLRQLPFEAEGSEAHGYEVVFQAGEPLDVSRSDEGKTPAGTLAYYGPNRNVCMFFKDEPGNDELYVVGSAVRGAGNIRQLTGKIKVSEYK